MAKASKPQQSATKEGQPGKYPNSHAAVFPNFNEEAVFTPGMTKLEYAVVEFIAAHLEAHGKYPTKDQLMSLAELGVQVFDRLIPAMAVSQINPALAEFPLEENPE